MFTVKVMRSGKGSSMTIVSAEKVTVRTVRPNELVEVQADNEMFILVNPNKPRPGDIAADALVWSVAYIENPGGATTQTVKFC